MFKYGIIIN